MTDENTPKTETTDAAPPPAADDAPPPVRAELEVNEATDLGGTAEVAEIVPAAEVVHDVVAPEPVPEPPADAPAEPTELLALPPADEPAAESAAAAQPVAELPADEPTPPEPTDAPAAEAPTEPSQAPAKKPRKSSKAAAAVADPTTPEPAAAPTEPAGESKKKWYVVKIQSGREDSIKAAIERKVKIEGLEEFYGQIAIPVEEYQEVKKVTEKKNGERVTKEKKVVKQRKKFPGYLFAEVEYNDRILYLFRDTSGVGDFVGASQHRAPTPMTDKEVQSMLTGVVDKDAKKKGPTRQVVKLEYEKGDKVKIRDGPFANMEGEVKVITEAKETGETPKVTVEVTIFGRPVPVELDYWHVDKV